jgi:two-component system sensor histidine kinase/response regulator
MLTEQAQEEGQDGFLEDLESITTAARQLLAMLDHTESPPLDSERALDTATAHRASSSVEPVRVPTTLVLSEQTPASILVVDDNRVNRDLLSRRLIAQGHQPVMAENGREALEAVRRQPFDLVLLDIMMPELDGYAVLSEIKADKELCHLPVIMISALNEIDSVVRCIELGAEDYLTKPFNSVLLRARVGSSLDKKRAHDRETHLFWQLHENYELLRTLERQRDDLTNMIVHDLRTPLSSVITGMQTLEGMGGLDDDRQEMVEIAIAGGQTLLGMINDLLDVEKLESGSMQLESDVVSIENVTQAAIGQVRSLADSRGLTIARHIEGDLLPLRCDRDKLCRVLVNLLGNAIKFTPSGGALTLRARYELDSRSAEFSVSDTGEGIPPSAVEHIFEKFGQVETRQGGRTMSTGLGLTFCKLAVEAHGGRIRVESSPGQGSTFVFTIPSP